MPHLRFVKKTLVVWKYFADRYVKTKFKCHQNCKFGLRQLFSIDAEQALGFLSTKKKTKIFFAFKKSSLPTSIKLFNASPLISLSLAASSKHAPAHSFRFSLRIKFAKINFSK